MYKGVGVSFADFISSKHPEHHLDPQLNTVAVPHFEEECL